MVSFTRGVTKQRSSDVVSSRGTEDEDALSVVTWDPAFANMDDNVRPMSSSTVVPSSSSPFTNLIGGSSTSSHRRHQSEIVGGRNSISLESEMDGNLIDSNLEPHYSNLIDSANAPIFGVDSAGRVNVWNKCAMRIVGYNEVMGKVSLYPRKKNSPVPHLIYSCLIDLYIFYLCLPPHTNRTSSRNSSPRIIKPLSEWSLTLLYVATRLQIFYEFPLMTKDGIRIEIFQFTLVTPTLFNCPCVTF